MKLQQVAMLSTLILAGIAASPVAQADALLVKPGDIKWADSPALPKGGKTALIMGDPKQGPFVQRVKFPANYKYPAHTHPDARTITVLSGTLYFGEGDKFDAKKLQALPAGTFRSEVAKSPHFIATKGEVVLQVTATGPTGTDYVNPADDPRKK